MREDRLVSQRIKLTRHLNLAKVTLGQAVVQPHPALQDLLRFNDMESDTAEGDPLSSIEEDESSEEGSEIVESVLLTVQCVQGVPPGRRRGRRRAV